MTYIDKLQIGDKTFDILASNVSENAIDNETIKKRSDGKLYAEVGDANKYSFLKGKKVCFFGDSITAENMYPDAFCTLTGAIPYYRGQSGSSICGTSPQSICARMQFTRRNDNTYPGTGGLPSDADLIIVYGGINDWGHGVTFGSLEEAIPTESIEITWEGTKELPTTFCGGCKMLFKYLRESFPTTPIIALSLHHVYSKSFSDWNDMSSWDATTGAYTYSVKNGKTILDYKTAYEKAASLFGVPVIDLHNIGITPYDAGQLAEYYRDGLHFNEKGYTKMAHFVADQICTLLHEL